MLYSLSQFMQYPDADGFSQSAAANQLDGYVVSASFNSAPFSIQQAQGYCVQVTCPSTGSPVGTVKIQGSCDRSRLGYEQPDSKLVNWFDIGFIDQSTGAPFTSQNLSTTVPVVFQDSSAFYQWIRIVVTMASGSATLSVKVSWKGFAG